MATRKKSVTAVVTSEEFAPVTLISKNPTNGGGVEMEDTTVPVLNSCFSAEGLYVLPEEGRRLMTQEEIEETKEANGTSYLTDYTVPISDISHTLELLEKIGESQKEAQEAEIAELDKKLAESQSIREQSANSFYSEIKMELSQARPVTVKEILTAKEVSTVDCTRFTDRFKEVRDAVWALNKKGDREYVTVKEGKVAVLVWRVK